MIVNNIDTAITCSINHAEVVVVNYHGNEDKMIAECREHGEDVDYVAIDGIIDVWGVDAEVMIWRIRVNLVWIDCEDGDAN